MTVALRHEGDDRVLPFAVEGLDVRGRVVRLGASIDTILERHTYPAPVSRVLGEAVALTVLLGASLKFEGRFQLQTRSDGPVDMVVVDFDTPDRVRACARFDAERLAGIAAEGAPSTGTLLGQGHLALTIDQGADMARYQGVVALQGQDFQEAAHQYFRQSEQIPTFVRLAVGEEFISAEGKARHSFRAGGLIMQFLPKSPERMRQADLHPGDALQDQNITLARVEDDAWTEAKVLAETIEDHELLDPNLSSERLLYRLFHERGVRVFEASAVHEACRCSTDRILAMLHRFSPEDRRDMVGDDGRIGITCEFCSRHYDFDPATVEAGIEASQA
ncbi:Hsp33 family molecular chaperone [Chelatococcus sp. SYSU_G07232]|uniref:Hsp33 family molecular chaperone n=1 Tax=Chelatococcus albus TaxID=3047466 RepID=A0ABT7AF81_9HYPH|nr:Hsp33 family molecular chaperone [Chelatococcus sp. SYSU_G07232]MDJ1158011.1 Hsp33 family molecular chaperone [Chelatococcus sp. SYSU_G07232]